MKISTLWAGAVRSNLLLGAAALLAGTAAFLLAKHYLASQAALLEQQFAQRLQARQVLVAAKPLATGDVAAEGSLARRDMPVSFLLSSGITTPTALAAPVELGMMFSKMPRPPRQSLLEGPSTVFCVAVVAWTVVIKPRLMPHF